MLYPCLPEESVLVDFGCGKGRVLLVALECGFKKVRGVEFARELCLSAEKNLERFAALRNLQGGYEILQTDASLYQIRKDERVFFFYNPFDGSILARVLDNLLDSLREDPREVFIVYKNPRWSNIFEADGNFVRLGDIDHYGHRFLLYGSGTRPESFQA